MSTGIKLENQHGVFFITFSCYKWMNLFEITNGYDLVYKWFDYLIEKGHHISDYVIMPNHVHVLIGLNNSTKAIDLIVSNGKRFIAYGLVKKLEDRSEDVVLNKLSANLTSREKTKGQKHHVFETGFDVKVCETEKFMEQKVNYIHMNPCRKKWKLVDNPMDYEHSSMRFYEEYVPGVKSKLTPYTALFE